jgi:hypothetical protein
MSLARVAAFVALAAAAAWAAPAAAQQAGSDSPPALRLLNLRPPAPDIAIAADRDARLSADPDQGGVEGCEPAWPCRLQLFGVIDKNGGVGLKGTALTW